MPHTPVKQLNAQNIMAEPFYHEFNSETDTATFFLTCERCGKPFASGGYGHECPHCEEWEDEGSEIMYNFIYPVTLRGEPEDYAKALAHLPLAIVRNAEDETFLALTGCGMDLSWQIVEGYMRLGQLPPIHFADLPHMAGKRLNTTNRWILAGVARSLRMVRDLANYDLKRVRCMRHNLDQ